MASLVINELLCYMLAKIDSVPAEVLTRLVNENFSDGEVNNAKSLLCQHVDDSIKAGSKRGQNKKKHDLDDIVKMLVQCDRSVLPRFVAYDLAKLPPISIDCIDVSALMRKQQLQDIEISNLKELMQELLTVTADNSKRIEVGLRSSQHSPAMEMQVDCHAKTTTDTKSQKLTLGKPEVTSEPASVISGPKYSEVVRHGGNEGNEWSVANKQKRARAPAPRKTADTTQSPAAPTGVSRGNQEIKTRSTTSKAVIGSRMSGPIKAVAAVKRLSLFMSRLPPGTGEDAIKAYVMEQTGADDVSAVRLKTKFDSYESYRLDIVNPARDVLEPELWAHGLVVRRFFTRRQSPLAEPPVNGRPVSEPLVNMRPVTEPPANRPPGQAVTAESPVNRGPVTAESLVNRRPVTEPPVSRRPDTDSPAAVSPVSEAPTSEAPATESQTTELQAAGGSPHAAGSDGHK